jgi:hypothetical protein
MVNGVEPVAHICPECLYEGQLAEFLPVYPRYEWPRQCPACHYRKLWLLMPRWPDGHIG